MASPVVISDWTVGAERRSYLVEWRAAYLKIHGLIWRIRPDRNL